MSKDNIILNGRVQKGEGLGSKMGFPTANLPDELLKQYNIDHGLYAAWGTISKGPKLPAIVIAGVPYKFSRSGAKLEVYFIDFHGNLRDKMVTAELVQFIRPISEFKDVDSLIQQITSDIVKTKSILGL